MQELKELKKFEELKPILLVYKQKAFGLTPITPLTPLTPLLTPLSQLLPIKMRSGLEDKE